MFTKRSLKNMKKNKGYKVAIIGIFVLLLMITALVANKVTDIKYNGKVLVSNVTVTPKTSEKNVNTEVTEVKNTNVISGYDTVKYTIKYKLETDDKREISGRTAIIEASLSNEDIKYATWNTISSKNVSSEIINEGKTLQITVKDITTNKGYEIDATLNITGAPNNYNVSPIVSVKEKTSDEVKKSAGSLNVQTTSVSGTIVNNETNNSQENVSLSICKIDDAGCINKKVTYSNSDGSYTFSNLTTGTYNVSVEDNNYESLKSQIEVKDGDNESNITVTPSKLFKATIKKYIKKVYVTENGQTKEYDYDKVNQIALAVKNMANSHIQAIYEFEISNNSEKAGYVKVIRENIPEGMELDPTYQDNNSWKEVDGILYNKSLSTLPLQVGSTVKLTVGLKTKSTTLAKSYVNIVELLGETYHNVNYIVDGTTVKQLTVLDTDLIYEEAIPDKAGHKVLGWYTDKEGKNKYNFNSPVLNDINLYATYEKDKFDVTFNNKLKDYEITEEVEYGDTVDEPKKDNEVDGYTFKCWQKLDDTNKDSVVLKENYDETKCYDFETPVTEELDLIAVYTRNYYNVKFMNKDDEDKYVNYQEPMVVEHGTLISAPTPEPTKEGYTFVGWYESEDEGKTLKKTPFNFLEGITKDTTLYSKFDKDTVYFDVTFIVQNNSDIVKVEQNTKVAKPNNPNIQGYRFINWYESEDGGVTLLDAPFDFDTLINKNTTIVAKLVEADINVTFKDTDENGGQEYPEYNTSVEYNTPVDRPLTDPVKPCLEFKYWSLYESGLDSEGNEAPFDFSTLLTTNTTLYAIFEEKEVKVTYVDKGQELTDEDLENIKCGDVIPLENPNICDDPNGCVCDNQNGCKGDDQFECWRDAENPSVCIPEDTKLTKDITLVSSYIKLPTPVITHLPTEWTNQNVMVTMNFPTDVKKVRKISTKTVSEDGTIVYGVTEEQTEEDLVLTSDKYEMNYQVVSEKAYSDETTTFEPYILSNTWNTYSESFEQEKNSIIVGKILVKDTKEKGENLEHQITNIDKKTPEIISLEAIEIRATSFKVKVKALDLQSGTNIIKIFVDDSEEPIYTEVYDTNLRSEKILTYKISGLTALTDYTVRVEVTDLATNTAISENLDVTTTEGIIDYVAQIIGVDGTLYETTEEYRPFSTLEEAIEECGYSQCTIQMIKNTQESVDVLEGKDITLDLNGKTVLGTDDSSYTIQNYGNFIVVDNSTEESIGSIISTTGVAINNISGVLQIGEGEESGAEVSKVRPYILGNTKGIDSEANCEFKFLDGIIEGTVAIEGEVTLTPFAHNPTIKPSETNSQVATLSVLAAPEARIGTTYYSKLLYAMDDAENGSYGNIKTPGKLGEFLVNTTGEFIYDDENNTITSSGSRAKASITIDLFEYEKNQLLSYTQHINTGYSHNAEIYLYDLETNTKEQLTYYGSSTDSRNNIEVTKELIKGKKYKLEFYFSQNTYFSSAYFQIKNLLLRDYDKEDIEFNLSTDLVSPNEYKFNYDSATGKLISNNQDVDESTAHSYLVADLTGEAETKTIKINAEISSEDGLDVGYITVTNSPSMPEYYEDEGRQVYLTGEIAADDYEITLTPGQVNYIHFGYYKDSFDYLGTDTFTINSIGNVNDVLIIGTPTKEISKVEYYPILNTEVSTVEILKSITLEEANVVIPSSQNVILDLNGHELTKESEVDAIAVIENYGTLKIINSKYNSDTIIEDSETGIPLYNGRISSADTSLIYNYEGAILEVEDFQLNANARGSSSNFNEYGIYNKGTLSMNENMYFASTAYYNTSLYNTEIGNIIKYGGTINASYVAFENYNPNQDIIENLILKNGTLRSHNNPNLIVQNIVGSGDSGIYINDSNATIKNVHLSEQSSIGLSGDTEYSLIDSSISSSNNSTSYSLSVGAKKVTIQNSTIDSIYDKSNWNYARPNTTIINSSENLIIQNSTIKGNNAVVILNDMPENKIEIDKDSKIESLGLSGISIYNRDGEVELNGTSITSSNNAILSGDIIKLNGATINCTGVSNCISTRASYSKDETIAETYINDSTIISSATAISNTNKMELTGKNIIEPTSNLDVDGIINTGNLLIKDELELKQGFKIGINSSKESTITLGEKDENISTSYPIINAREFSIVDRGVLNYYDGKLIGKKDDSLVAIINDSIENHDLHIEQDENYETITLESFETKQQNSDYSAAIGDKKYITISSAIADSKQKDTISILKNVRSIYKIEIPSNKEVTLDLQGFKVQTFNIDEVIKNDGIIKITDNTRLVSDDVVVEGSGQVYTSNVVKIINNTNKLDLESGLLYYSGNENITVIENSNTINITGGSFNGVRNSIDKSPLKYYYANKIVNNEGSTMNISSGTFVNYDEGNLISNLGEVTITGGSFNKTKSDNASHSYISINLTNFIENKESGTLNISGGIYSFGTSDELLLLNYGKSDIKNITFTQDYIKNIGTLNFENVVYEVPKYPSAYDEVINFGEFNSVNSTITKFRSGCSFDNILCSSKAIVNLKNTNIYHSIINDGVSSLTIIGGTINENKASSYAVQNKGTLTLGIKGDRKEDGTLNLINDSPIVYGLSNSPAIETTGTFNFYDGVLKGNPAIEGITTEIEDNTMIKVTSETIDGNTYEVKYLEPISSAVQVIDSDGKIKAEYNYIQTAFENITSGDTVKLLRDISVASTETSITIPEEIEVKLDLNGMKLDVSVENFITNNGTLKMIDTGSQNGSYISSANQMIINNGTLEIAGATINSNLSVAPESYAYNNNIEYIFKDYYIIKNTGTLKMEDGEISQIGQYQNGIINTENGVAYFNGGTISTNVRSSYYYEDYYFTIYSDSTNNMYFNGTTVSQYVKNASSGEINVTSGSITYLFNKGTGNVTVTGGTISKLEDNTETTTTISNASIERYQGYATSTIQNSTIYYLNLSSNVISTITDTTITSELYNRGTATVDNSKTQSNIASIENISTLEIIYTKLDNYINNRNTASLTIKDIDINTSNSYAIQNENILILESGTITSSNMGIKNVGILTLGIKDGEVKEQPKINAKVGIDKGSYTYYGTINYYDGVIISKTIENCIVLDDVEDGYTLVENSTDDGYKIELSNTTHLVSLESTNKNYTSIQEAFTEASTNDKITLLRKVILPRTTSSITIPETKEIIFDLNGYEFRTNKTVLIYNNGTLKITDNKFTYNSSNPGKSSTGMIRNVNFDTKGYSMIQNYGEMNVENMIFTRSWDSHRNSNYFTYNMATGTLNVNNSCILGTITSTGTTYVNSGYVSTTSAVSDGSMYLNGGTIATAAGGGMTYVGNPNNISTGSNEDVKVTTLSAHSIISYGTINKIETSNEIEMNGGEVLNGGYSQSTFTITNGTINNEFEVEATNSRTYLIIQGGTFKSDNIAVSTYNTTVEMSGGLISAGTIGISNSEYSINKISGGTINSNDTAISYGRNEITGGTIYGKKTALYNSTGSPNVITGGTITSDDVAIKSGTFNIGIYDTSVNTEVPRIQGGNYGIYGAKINFYDGIIIGANGQSINGTINETPDRYRISYQTTVEGTEEATLIPVGEDEIAIMMNGSNYSTLEDAIAAVPATGVQTIMKFYRNVPLTQDIVIPAGKNILIVTGDYQIEYNGFTISGDGTWSIVTEETSTTSSDGLLGTIRALLNIDEPTNVKKNIVIYESDNGELLESGYTYELQMLVDDKYEKVDVTETLNNVGRYKIATKESDDVMVPINGRIYINDIPDGNYRLVGTDNKVVTFTITSDGSLTGNIKENHTSNLTSVMSSASAEIIANIRTGNNVVKYGLIITILSTLIVGLVMLNRKRRSL